jgi:hypothetical protein
MKIEKFVLSIKIQTKKEAIKMKKKFMACLVILLMIGMNVLPAFAYTELIAPGSQISASGVIDPIAASFSVSVVTEAGATSDLTFLNTTNAANSGKLLKITAATNVVNNRIIIYTDNDSYFTNKSKDPRAYWNTGGTAILGYSGADGGGLVGVTDKGYIASMFWGASDTPNVCAAYTFTATNRSYIVDKWHKMSYAPLEVVGGVDTYPLDTAPMYPAGSGTAVTNGAAEGVNSKGEATNYPWLYPQSFGDVAVLPAIAADRDLYSGPNSTGRVISEALYKNIATVAYSISAGGVIGSVDYTGWYVCSMPKFSTPDATDNIVAKLKKIGAGTDEYIYLPIGADFTGLPAQTYSTANLYVALVQN